MPIRFRCAYCNQLMGIARRKSGAVVSCPKCNGQVVVPSPEAEAAAGNPPLGPAGGGLFDVSEFGNELVRDNGPAQPFHAAPEPMAWNNPIAFEPGEEFDVVPFTGNIPKPGGIVLTPIVLTLTGVLVVMLVGLAFVLGLLIGRAQ